MLGRFGRLSLLTLSIAFAAAGKAWAHRLEAEASVLPGQQKVQVESWFDLTAQPARGAKVQVFRPDGQLLSEGRLDDQGVFIFPFDKVEMLRVVVSAGAGHRKELTIPETELRKGLPAGTTESSAPALVDSSPSTPRPHADRSARVSAKDVLVGFGFLLAVAAFVLSVRNARQLRKLRRRTG
jgi:nickel transport protein